MGRQVRFAGLPLMAACLFAGFASRLAADEGPSAPPPAPSEPAPAPSVCLSASALACNVPPAGDKPEELCAALNACLATRSLGYGHIKRLDACEIGSRLSVDGGAVTELAAVSARMTADDDDDTVEQDVAYFFARYAGGWCPVAPLLAPLHAPSRCDDAFNLRWEPAADGGGTSNAFVQSQRVCHESFDPEPTEPGGSDIYSTECIENQYRVAEGHFELATRRANGGTCKRPRATKSAR